MILEATVGDHSVRVEVRERESRLEVVLDGRPLEVDVTEAGRGFLSLLIDGNSYEVGLTKQARGYAVVLPDDVLTVELAVGARGAGAPRPKAGIGPFRVTAPMPGKIVRVLVEAGQDVTSGQGLVVMEAMKMENELKASRAGRVKDIAVREGQAVETGALLATLD